MKATNLNANKIEVIFTTVKLSPKLMIASLDTSRSIEMTRREKINSSTRCYQKQIYKQTRVDPNIKEEARDKIQQCPLNIQQLNRYEKCEKYETLKGV